MSKQQPEDARITVTIPRADFNALAEKGELTDFNEAWERGSIKASGDPNVQKLIGQVVSKQLDRARLKKSH